MNQHTAKLYTAAHWSQLAALLEEWPFKHGAGYADCRAKGSFELTLSRVADALRNPQSICWIAERDERVTGFAALSALPWDSELLGVSAARLDYLVATGSYADQYQIKDVLLKEVLAQAKVQAIQHLSVRVDASDLSGLHLLEQAGFISVDAIITFALDVKSLPPAPVDNGISTRIAGPSGGEATARLARKAYVYDRFHSDPALPFERSDELHAAWLRNSCAGLAADVVVLAEDKDGLLGFVTGKLQRDTKAHLGKLIGTIVLVATDQRARGRGVARKTTASAVDWFRQQGADIVEVGTQLRNISASRLYQRCGFDLVGSSVSLRKLLKEI